MQKKNVLFHQDNAPLHQVDENDGQTERIELRIALLPTV